MRWVVQLMYSSGHISGLLPWWFGGKESTCNAGVKWSESGSVLHESFRPHGLYSPSNFPGQNTGVGNISLLHGVFPSQGSNPGFPHCRRILYQLRHKGSPRKLEWVAYPFSSGSSRPRNLTGVSGIAGGFFTNWAIREAMREKWVQSQGWGDPWRRKRQRTPVFLPGKSNGQRNLASCSPWGLKEKDTTQWVNNNTPGYWRQLDGLVERVFVRMNSSFSWLSEFCSDR